MAARDHCREENQYIFQAANERLHDAVESRLPESTQAAFICECADDECFERMEVAPGEWKDVADRSDHFLIVAGHPRIEGERVIDALGPLEIVSKANA